MQMRTRKASRPEAKTSETFMSIPSKESFRKTSYPINRKNVTKAAQKNRKFFMGESGAFEDYQPRTLS